MVRLGSEFCLRAGADHAAHLRIDWQAGERVTLSMSPWASPRWRCGSRAWRCRAAKPGGDLQAVAGGCSPASSAMHPPCFAGRGDGRLRILVATEFAADLHERPNAAGADFLSPAGSLAQEALDIAPGRPRSGIEATPQLPAVATGLDAVLDPYTGNRGFIGRGAPRCASARRAPPRSSAPSTSIGPRPASMPMRPSCGSVAPPGISPGAPSYPLWARLWCWPWSSASGRRRPTAASSWARSLRCRPMRHLLDSAAHPPLGSQGL